jgi:uncharacterized protein (DUF58 family)
MFNVSSTEFLGLLRRAGGRPRPADDVSEVRDYVPGDDYRHVDWAWCARRDELLTRIFPPAVPSHTTILLDCSASMALGQPAKFTLARHVAAALGCAALATGGSCGVAPFSQAIRSYIRPPCGASGPAHLLRRLEELEPRGGPTDLVQAAAVLARCCPRRGALLLLGDLHHRGGFERGLAALRDHGFRPDVIQVCDAADAQPQTLGDVGLYDVEEPGVVTQATLTPRIWQRYRQLEEQFKASVAAYCRRQRLKCVQLPADLALEQALRRAIVILSEAKDLAR